MLHAADPTPPRSGSAKRPLPRPRAIAVVVHGPMTPDEADRLCKAIATRVFASRPVVVVCDVAGVTDPTIGTIDVLARMALVVRRAGAQVRLRGATGDLRALLALCGLEAVLPCLPDQSSRRRGSPKSGK